MHSPAQLRFSSCRHQSSTLNPATPSKGGDQQRRGSAKGRQTQKGFSVCRRSVPMPNRTICCRKEE
jgi:hypothetical protein